MINSRTFLIAAFFTGAALSAEAKVLSEHGDWIAAQEMENGKPACVMSSTPQKSEGKYARRGDIFALISHRPAEKRIGEVGFQAGYTFKKGSDVTVTIDRKKSFKLFTHGEFAWTTDAKMDKNIAAAMRAGSTLVVEGVSSRGTQTRDTYSLKGFTAALKAINTACGVK